MCSPTTPVLIYVTAYNAREVVKYQATLFYLFSANAKERGRPFFNTLFSLIEVEGESDFPPFPVS